jgi:PLP dependent protein
MITWYAALGVGQLPRGMMFSSQSVHGSFAHVCKNIEKAVKSRPQQMGSVQLVVVSKTKPLELLKEAYDAGARSFGENYIQEMCDKAPGMPLDCKWHFIGHLQSNKVIQLLIHMLS